MKSSSATEIRRNQAEFLPLFRRELVDDRLVRELPIGRLLPERHGGAEGGDIPLITGHDGGFAAQGRACAPSPTASTDGDFLIVAVVLGAAGDVLDRAIGVMGVDGELLLVVAGSSRDVRGRC